MWSTSLGACFPPLLLSYYNLDSGCCLCAVFFCPSQHSPPSPPPSPLFRCCCLASCYRCWWGAWCFTCIRTYVRMSVALAGLGWRAFVPGCWLMGCRAPWSSSKLTSTWAFWIFLANFSRWMLWIFSEATGSTSQARHFFDRAKTTKTNM